MTRRSYTDTEKAEAVGRAAIVGPVRAARELSIPHRNVSAWMADPRFATIREASHESIVETLRTAAAAAADDLLRVIRDPQAADRDKVRAAEVALDRYQLMSGGATERTENMNMEITSPAFTTPEIRAELVQYMALIENATDEELEKHEAKAERFLQLASSAAMYDPDDQRARAAYKRDLRAALGPVEQEGASDAD